MKNSETKDFTIYEYLSVNIKPELEHLYIDCYENFGWILISNNHLTDKEDYYINSYDFSNQRLINIKFKRDLRIKNKVELLALQKSLEKSLKKVEKLENKPSSIGISLALAIGIVGLIFLMISIFMLTSSNLLYIIKIVCGLIGIVGIILPYFVYRNVKLKQELETASLIEEEYNNIYESCKQAKELID